jgi:hypothetical protein
VKDVKDVKDVKELKLPSGSKLQGKKQHPQA